MSTPAMDALRYYQDRIEPLSNEELIASALIELATRVSELEDAKQPCLHPLPDGRRCCECDTCQGTSTTKVCHTHRWNTLRSEIAFQGFGWWLLRLLRGQRIYGWKLWKP